uniref:Putative secreted protein n=1 Tax=Amblyomma parvum TaxID=251391 RepID=A0A023G2I0_AMBPA
MIYFGRQTDTVAVLIWHIAELVLNCFWVALLLGPCYARTARSSGCRSNRQAQQACHCRKQQERHEPRRNSRQAPKQACLFRNLPSSQTARVPRRRPRAAGVFAAIKTPHAHRRGRIGDCANMVLSRHGPPADVVCSSGLDAPLRLHCLRRTHAHMRAPTLAAPLNSRGLKQ